MLNSLYIENVAVIEKTDIELFDGLNILTGETGAGKSIFIDAINAVMGQRTSKEIIRNGADSATVFATFTNVNDAVIETLSDNGYDLDEDELVISRTLSLSGKGNCRINGKPATISLIRQLSLNLINIHGQHESYQLFTPETHIKYIDNMADNSQLIEKYKVAFSNYKKLKKQLKAFETDENQRLQRIDVLTYQVNEIDNASVVIGEKEALEEERSIISSSEKIAEALQSSKSCLNGSNTNAVDIIDDCLTSLIKASNYNPELESLSNRVSDVYYELQDVSNCIEEAIDNCEFNPYRLEEIDDRLDLLRKLSKKYGETEEEILEFLEKACTELEILLQYDTNRNALYEQCEKAKNEVQKIADELTDSRLKTAKIFEERVKYEMTFLNMPRVELVVSHNKTDLHENGQDFIELLISANPGEEPKPVAKIASGGELSRMMLAIKTVLASNDVIDTLIFDEIDTGISGSAAQKVGLKLREVSKSRQVLCVTHQAQIAALADNHFLISKNIKEDRTYTEIKHLDYEGRLSELARILDGVSVTDTALAHAKQLMNFSEEEL